MPIDRPRRDDRPPSALPNTSFGVRSRVEHDVPTSVIKDRPVARHALTRLLAPSQADPEQSGSAREGARSGRRIGRDTSLASPSSNLPTGQTPDEAVSQISAAPDASRRIASVSDLGAIVRRQRILLGFSQQRLADLAGTGRRFVSELEAGKPTLEFDRVVQCCAALGIDLFVWTRR
jgi:y4mF family transcriptional regulator